MEDKIIYQVDGNMGKTITVYENRCTISINKGGKAFFWGGLAAATSGDKEFYYQDLTSIQFKNLGHTTGYLQFEYAGAHSGSNFNSENSFTFSATIGSKKHKMLQEQMSPVADYIKERIRFYKSNQNSSTSSVSNADEIKKYKELLDLGVISQEEFDAKKKKLLGL